MYGTHGYQGASVRKFERSLVFGMCGQCASPIEIEESPMEESFPYRVDTDA